MAEDLPTINPCEKSTLDRIMLISLFYLKICRTGGGGRLVCKLFIGDWLMRLVYIAMCIILCTIVCKIICGGKNKEACIVS